MWCSWHLAEASGTATVTLDGMGNTIDDAEFFPDLPGLVNGVADRLSRLMDLDKRLISALHKVLPPPSTHSPLIYQGTLHRHFSALAACLRSDAAAHEMLLLKSLLQSMPVLHHMSHHALVHA